MSNNYDTHLDYELRAKLAEANELKAIAEALELLWKRTIRRRSNAERLFRLRVEAERIACAGFRSAHARFVSVRQEIGEIQDEYFRNGEEAEDWH